MCVSHPTRPSVLLPRIVPHARGSAPVLFITVCVCKRKGLFVCTTCSRTGGGCDFDLSRVTFPYVKYFSEGRDGFCKNSEDPDSKNFSSPTISSFFRVRISSQTTNTESPTCRNHTEPNSGHFTSRTGPTTKTKGRRPYETGTPTTLWSLDR